MAPGVRSHSQGTFGGRWSMACVAYPAPPSILIGNVLSAEVRDGVRGLSWRMQYDERVVFQVLAGRKRASQLGTGSRV